jgi:hypothetical protein
MPRDQPLPMRCDLLGPFSNIKWGIQQEIHARGIRSGTEGVDGCESGGTEAISPVRDLGMMSTCAPGMVVKELRPGRVSSSSSLNMTLLPAFTDPWLNPEGSKPLSGPRNPCQRRPTRLTFAQRHDGKPNHEVHEMEPSAAMWRDNRHQHKAPRQ